MIGVYKRISKKCWFVSQHFFVLCCCLIIWIKANAQINYVTIPKGVYQLGQKGHYTNPLHSAAVDSFKISTTEITNAEFEKFILATNYKTDAEKHKNARVFKPGLAEFTWLDDSTAYWRFPNGTLRGGIESKMQHPVTCISYRDALAFCKWLEVRLPTLDEWEIASRCGANTTFAWGNNRDSLGLYANIWHGTNHLTADTSDGFMYTSPVASFAPNAWGLYDMYGNLFELCAGNTKRYKHYKQIVHARGGSWWCSAKSCSYFNSVDIGRVSKYASFSNQGFRVAKSLK
jgi:formylglycine-generating enzyme